MSSGKARTYRHSIPEEHLDPASFALFVEYDCQAHEVGADELEEVLRELIVSERANPQFREQLQRAIESDQYRTSAEKQAQDARIHHQSLERQRSAIVDSEIDAVVAGRNPEPYREKLSLIETQLREAKAALDEANRTLASHKTAWTRTEEILDETAGIDQMWDSLTLAEKGVIYKHWVVAVFIAVRRIEGRKRGHPRTAIVYLASDPLDPRLVPLGGDSANSISPLTQSSASSAARSESNEIASGEPTVPSAQAACPRTSEAGSTNALASTATPEGDPQLPNATHTLRSSPLRPALSTGEPAKARRNPRPDNDKSLSANSTSGGPSNSGLAEYAGSSEGTENLRLNGQTSWQMSHP